MKIWTQALLAGAVSVVLAGNQQLSGFILDFDTDANGNAIQAGQIIDEEYAPWGVHISTTNLQSSSDIGIAFDTENPTGGDYDLRTGAGAYGVGNDPSDPLGNALIIAEDSRDYNNDGLIDDPDDEGGRPAGYHTFLFDMDMLGGEVTLLDIEERYGSIFFYLDGSLLSGQTVSIPNLGDNSRQTLAFSGFVFDQMRIFLKGSGAVDNVTLVPTPEPSTMLLLGSATAALVRARRKQKKFA